MDYFQTNHNQSGLIGYDCPKSVHQARKNGVKKNITPESKVIRSRGKKLN